MTRYKPGNPYSVHIPLADAAVEWSHLPAADIEQVRIGEDGLPYLDSVPEVHKRALGILDAVHHRIISGAVHTEGGDYRHPKHMALDPDSLAGWISSTERRLARPEKGSTLDFADVLLTKAEVCERLHLSRATFDRRRAAGEFPPATHAAPNRWTSSVVAEYIAAGAIRAAATGPAPLGDI